MLPNNPGLFCCWLLALLFPKIPIPVLEVFEAPKSELEFVWLLGLLAKGPPGLAFVVLPNRPVEGCPWVVDVPNPVVVPVLPKRLGLF